MIKWILSIVSVFLIAGMFLVYYFPSQEFDSNFFKERDNSFGNSSMQFYANMRYQYSNIGYSIVDCPLNKADEIERAFIYLSNKTNVVFYNTNYNPNIIAECSSKVVYEGKTFVAGEGGPTKIIQSGDFNVIYEGRILMIRPSDCERPNVAIHEILHAMGFVHSDNPNNIMYSTSRCSQVLDQEIIDEINRLYSIDSLSDLLFENVSVSIDGRRMNAVIKIVNNGLIDSLSGDIRILADSKIVNEYSFESISPGAGIIISLQNIFVPSNVNEVILEIISDEDELDKNNNKVILINKK